MSNVKKRIEELDLMDDFLFAEASIDPKAAPILMRLIIERAARLKVGKLIIEPQKTVNGVDTDCHGIRMDVTVREVTDTEGKTIQLFDVEPNNIKEVHLPYDPFGLDYMLYSVKNIVEESPEIEYNDGVRKLFLYTGGKKGGTKALQDLLAYIENSTEENAVDDDLRRITQDKEYLKKMLEEYGLY